MIKTEKNQQTALFCLGGREGRRGKIRERETETETGREGQRVGLCVRVCVYLCIQRLESTLGIARQGPFTSFFETEFLTGLGLAK